MVTFDWFQRLTSSERRKWSRWLLTFKDSCLLSSFNGWWFQPPVNAAKPSVRINYSRGQSVYHICSTWAISRTLILNYATRADTILTGLTGRAPYVVGWANMSGGVTMGNFWKWQKRWELDIHKQFSQTQSQLSTYSGFLVRKQKFLFRERKSKDVGNTLRGWQMLMTGVQARKYGNLFVETFSYLFSISIHIRIYPTFCWLVKCLLIRARKKTSVWYVWIMKILI